MRSYHMMKTVAVLLILSGVLFTASCKKITYHQLTDEDMSWLVYQNNQVDLFMNGNNETVSYRVAIRTKSYYDNGDVSNEFTTATFKQLNDTTAYYYGDSEGLLYIYKPDANGLLVTLSWPHFPLKSVPLTTMIPTLATVSGVNYNDVYILDATGFTDARFYVRTIWYSKSVGVIQYEDVSGDIWIKNF